MSTFPGALEAATLNKDRIIFSSLCLRGGCSSSVCQNSPWRTFHSLSRPLYGPWWAKVILSRATAYGHKNETHFSNPNDN